MKNGKKIDYDKILKVSMLLVCLVLGVIAAAWLLPSCSDAKQAQSGYNKFIKHGGKFECEPTIVTLRDTIKGKDGKDSIVEVQVKVPCPKVETPKTRLEIRFDHKRFKDSLDFLKQQYMDSLKYALKSNKIDSKTQIKISNEQTKQVKSKTKEIVKTAFPWEWFFVAVVAICLMLYLIFRKK